MTQDPFTRLMLEAQQQPTRRGEVLDYLAWWLPGQLRWVLQNPWDLEEVVNDAMFCVMKNLHLFDGRTSAHAWVRAMAVNLARSHHRRNKRHRRVISLANADGGLVIDPPSREPEPSLELEAREFEARVQKMLAAAGSRVQQLWWLRHGHGTPDAVINSYERIAELTGIPMHTVFRTLDNFRRKLQSAE
jgi:RNA polymerase sigma factor (sigma-70 family)